MQRTKKSLLNALAAILQVVVSGILGLVVIRFTITTFGSDFNGLNSAANQLITVLLLVEGGFTVAANVALFKPYGEGDYIGISAIFNAAKLTLRKLGIIALLVDFVLAGGYALLVHTDLSPSFVFSVVMMALLPASLNILVVLKYRLLIQAEQKEYLVSLLGTSTTAIAYTINIIAMLNNCDMWFIRFTTMCLSFIYYLTIFIYAKRRYRFIDKDIPPIFSAIKGTTHIVVANTYNLLYNALPLIAVTLLSTGTVLASVYSVYNSAFFFLQCILVAVTAAPRLGLGDIAAHRERDYVWSVFKDFQVIVFFCVFVTGVTAFVLVLPFVDIYTAGASDADYHQPLVALLLGLATILFVVRAPSGQMIMMSGHFRCARSNALIGLSVLLLALAGSAFMPSLVSVSAAVLLSCLAMALREISFIHRQYFRARLLSFMGLLLPFVLLAIPLIYAESFLLPSIEGYSAFFGFGLLLLAVNALIGIGVTFVVDRAAIYSILNRLKVALKKHTV